MKILILSVASVALLGLSTPAAAGPVDAAASVYLSRPHAKSTPTAFRSKPKVGTKARCPVMKGEFTITKNSKYSLYKGRYYFYCCPGCKPKFDANPSKYAGR